MALQPKIIACGNSVATFSMAVRFITGPAVMAASSIAVGLRGVLLHIAIVQVSNFLTYSLYCITHAGSEFHIFTYVSSIHVIRQPCHKELSLSSLPRSIMFILTYLAPGRTPKLNEFCSSKFVNPLCWILKICMSFVTGLYLEC